MSNAPGEKGRFGLRWKSWLPHLINSQGDDISAEIGKGAQGVAVGKNIVQIGTLVIPILPTLILVVILLAAAGGVYFYFQNQRPKKMDGIFNVAVAQFGQSDAQGAGKPSDIGKALSKQVYDSLKTELDNLPSSTLQNLDPQIWYDGPQVSKQVTIGIIPGTTAQARNQAACQLASAINAQVIIYGNLPQSGSSSNFVPETAICNNPALRIDADEIVGNYPGKGIPMTLLVSQNDPNAKLSVKTRLDAMVNSLSYLSIGIMYDFIGKNDQALKEFQAAIDQSIDAENNEVFWFFIGRENLYSKNNDTAQANFEEALKANPGYARAHIGLGSVYVARAQELPANDPKRVSDLEMALAEYQKAVDESANSTSGLIGPKAILSLGTAQLLQGEDQVAGKDLASGEKSFTAAINNIHKVLPSLTDNTQYRLSAQAYEAMASAYFQLGQIDQIKAAVPDAKSNFNRASQAYAACISQGQQAAYDKILNDQVVSALCVPYKKAVDDAIAALK